MGSCCGSSRAAVPPVGSQFRDQVRGHWRIASHFGDNGLDRSLLYEGKPEGPNLDGRRTHRSPPQTLPLVLLLGGFALAAVTGMLRYSAAQVPFADGNSILVDTAMLGPLVYDVEGPGVLEPEKVVWVSAVQAARVDQILFEAGARVTKDTVIARLSNPDFQLRALEGEHQLALARVEYGRLAAALADAQLVRDSNIAMLRRAALGGRARRGSLSQQRKRP